MYLRVRDIFALAADYDPSRIPTTDKTASELIAGRAGHAKPNMGLTVWKGKVVRKADVTVAKNYLSQDEIGELWLDFAGDQARRRTDRSFPAISRQPRLCG